MGLEPGVGNYLRPEELQGAMKANWANTNTQQQQEDERNKALLHAQIQREQMAQQGAQHADTIGLGYAKMPHELEKQRMQNEGLVGAAQAKGGFDVSKFLMGERGKDQRAGQKNQIDQQRVAGQDRRNDLFEQGLLQKDKPQPEKIPEMILLQMITQEKAAVQKVTGQPISDQEAYQRVMDRHRLGAASGQAAARDVMQGNEPAQVQQQQTQQARPPAPGVLSDLFGGRMAPQAQGLSPQGLSNPKSMGAADPDAIRRWAASGLPLADYLNQR